MKRCFLAFFCKENTTRRSSVIEINNASRSRTKLRNQNRATSEAQSLSMKTKIEIRRMESESDTEMAFNDEGFQKVS